jgi:hypothetical protein
MPLFTKNTNKQNYQQNQTSQQQNQQSSQQQQQAANPKETNFLQTISQCLPFLPLLFEQFTGQKIPQLQGTIAEIQASLAQIQLNQAQILANQEEIARHVENLENQANNQLTNLGQQMQTLQNTAVKLTHEKKEIEYKPSSPAQQLNN